METRIETPSQLGDENTEATFDYTPSRDGVNPPGGIVKPRAPNLRQLGRFQVRSVLGSGAFGTVYRAYDPVLDREVALKVPRFDREDDAMLERFLREAKAAAGLKHPNIVAIFETGQADGIPYIASEFVDGVPLWKRMRDQPPDLRTAVEWVRQIADALSYAHGEGIVHRDIKPANIMVSRAGRPQVMDFGLARRLDDEAARRSVEGQIIGTPAYMAPEQARGNIAGVGPHSDQYAVGAMLYEMLCGQTPFVGEPWSVLSSVANVQVAPPPPRVHRPGVPVDLEACCLKALEKEPADRYANMQALADDLQRWLEGRPLQARPIGMRERLFRWCSNNRLVASLIALVVILLSSAAIAGPLLALRFRDLAAQATRDADAAETARGKEAAARLATEQLLIDTYTETGLTADRNGDPGEAILWFTGAAARSDAHPLRALHNRIRLNSWLAEIAIPIQAFETAGTWHKSLAYHPSGRYLLAEAEGDPPTCELRDLRDGSLVRLPLDGALHAGAFSQDGRRLALASKASVSVFEFPSGKRLDQWKHHETIACLTFSPDGSQVAFGAKKSARIRNVPGKAFASPVLAHAARVSAVTFSADGKRLATRCANQKVRVFAVSGEMIVPAQPSGAEGKDVVPFFLDGRRLIIVDSGKSVSCWDTNAGVPLWTRPAERILAAAGSRDGKRVCLGQKYDALVLDAADGSQLGKAFAHRNLLYDVAFHPGGEYLLTACGDHTARIWSLTTGKQALAPASHQGLVSRCVWSPDGSTFATTHWSDQLVRVWKWGRPTARDFDAPMSARHAFVKLSADGRRFLPCGIDLMRDGRDLQVHDARTGVALGKRLTMPGLVSDATFVAGTHLILAGGSSRYVPQAEHVNQQDLNGPGLVRWHDCEKGGPAFADVPTPTEPIAVAVCPNGNCAVVLCQRGHLLLFDPRSGKSRGVEQAFHGQPAHHGYVIRDRIRFSPDGDCFAIWGSGPRVELRHARTGGLRARIEHATNYVHDVRFAPDGTRFASCSSDGTVRLWNCADGKPVGSELRHPGWVFTAQFSRDGKRLLTACSDRHARIWNLETGKIGVTTPAQSDEVYAVAFLPGDEIFLIGTRDGKISAWEATLGKMISPVRRLSDMVFQLAVTADGEHVIAAGRVKAQHGFDLKAWIRKPDRQFRSDELRRLGEILSSQHIHDGGAATRLSKDQWLNRWREFRIRYPDHPVLRGPV
ncbi:MAG: protein kinase [Planctomycetes bacterium]|nr:protein kinase [Planctomycetota bacterium]